jgi:hypothetical protein
MVRLAAGRILCVADQTFVAFLYINACATAAAWPKWREKVAAKRPIGGEGTGVMYAFLLSLGAAITAAGIALVASGVSLQDRAFDPSNVTPGAIAIIGGCILIALSFVVRALLRVERALNARAARSAQAGETAADTSPDPASGARIPVPANPNTTTAADPAEAAVPANAAAQASSEQSPAAERIESAPVVDAGDASLLPKEPMRADDDHGVAHAGLSNGKLNGGSHTTTAPRLAGGPARRPQPKNSIFDTLWPKGSSSPADAPPAPAPQPAAAAAATAQSASAEPLPAAGPSQTSATVSILKSGVVEGMAYTLYSDGSIEAQLPGGTVRFASITELRSHIEQNA